MGEFLEIFEEQLQTAASKCINFLFIIDFEEIFADYVWWKYILSFIGQIR